MKQYIVDAFTDKVFHGNQAAVCVLDEWPDEGLMMSITRENNFSETAFTVKVADGYDLRWFTPGGEISLCGHATLATGYVLFTYYDYGVDGEKITFHTMSGDLFVGREGDYLVMDFPAYDYRAVPVTPEMGEAMGVMPKEAYIARDLLLVYDDESAVRDMRPDFDKVVLLDGEGVGVTAPGASYDCVSRFFDPKLKVDEDPVTGSIHCMIAPYWAARLGKADLHAYQASERGGEMECVLAGDRVIIKGKAAPYSVGELTV